jgi:hypothetical protein
MEQQMARISVNSTCNVCTGDESKAYRSKGKEPAVEITIPRFRVRLLVWEVRLLSQALQQAVDRAEEEERKQHV